MLLPWPIRPMAPRQAAGRANSLCTGPEAEPFYPRNTGDENKSPVHKKREEPSGHPRLI